MKLEKIKLQDVELMPKQLEPGILYVTEKYGTAAHLCACGCGAKIRTPLGPTEWALRRTLVGPSLWPSVGNWQQKCRSHYIIDKGAIIWCTGWTPEQIAQGRLNEEARRRSHYDSMYSPPGTWERLWHWLRMKLGLK